jgi:hypothetical protein
MMAMMIFMEHLSPLGPLRYDAKSGAIEQSP